MTEPFDYSGFVQLALDMLATYGARTEYRKPADAAPGGDPWRDDRGGVPPTIFHPMLVFLSPIDAARGRGRSLSEMFGTGEDIVQYSEVALLAGDCGFVPDVTDTIFRNDISEIVSVDKIAPNGTPILYFLAIK